MGKFDGVLLLSDFDNTLVYTEDVLVSGGTAKSSDFYPALADNRIVTK